MGSRIWRLYLAGGVVAIAAYFLVVHVTFVGSLVYDLIGLSSVAAIVRGVRRHRPVRPVIWWCFAAGMLSFVIGDVLWALLDEILHVEPFPSVADGFYLGGYPLLALGLFVLIRGRTCGRDRAGLIDASIIATGLGLLSWIFIMEPVAADLSLSLSERLISLAYPLADVLLLAMVARLLTGPGARTTAYRLLAAGLGLLLLADIAYAGLTMFSVYAGGPVDAGWLLSYVLWGAAALHPSMRALSEVAPEQATRLSPSRLALLTATSLIAPAVLAYQHLQHQAIDALAIVLGSVVLFLLVVMRMSGLVSQVQDQAAQLDALAHNDGLTGIPNRRAWDLELPREMARARRQGWSVHVALLDLDHFKGFNDEHGHQGGDRLLKEATAAWRQQLRETDLLARYGGEEFGVLFLDSTFPQVADVLGRFRAVNPLGQTFSGGVAQWDGSESPERLVARADRALYNAKQAGRDRIETAIPPAAAGRDRPAESEALGSSDTAASKQEPSQTAPAVTHGQVGAGPRLGGHDPHDMGRRDLQSPAPSP